MADEAGSALIAQQKFAAQEPFEEIAANQKSLAQAMNSFQIGVTAAKARQQLENQLQMMTLRQQEMEADRDLKEKEFGVRTAQTQMGYDLRANQLQNTIQQQGFLNEMKLRDADLATKKADFVMGKYQDQADDTEGMLGAAASVPSKPGSPTFRDDLLNAVAPFPHAPASTRNKILSQAFNQHNDNVDVQNKAWQAEKDSLLQDASNAIYGTYTHKGSMDTSVFTDPDKYPQQMAEEPWTLGTFFGAGKGPPKPTGNRLVTLKNPTTGRVVEVRPVASQTLTDLSTRWKDLQARRPTAQPINDPSVGVYATPGGMVTVKMSNGTVGTLPQSQIQQAKQRDPGLVIVP